MTQTPYTSPLVTTNTCMKILQIPMSTEFGIQYLPEGRAAKSDDTNPPPRAERDETCRWTSTVEVRSLRSAECIGQQRYDTIDGTPLPAYLGG